MKKLYRKYSEALRIAVTTLTISAFLYSANYIYAAQVVSALDGDTVKYHSVLTNQAHIGSIVLANGSGSAASVLIYDSPTTNLTRAFNGYTNTVYSVSSTTNTYTDFAGVSQSIISTSLVATDIEVAAGTANYPAIANVTVPANSTLTVTLPAGGYTANFGLAFTNSVDVSATVTYGSIR